jgi:hypothetical protein
LQVGILLRNAVETLATVAVLNSDKRAYEAYKSGRFKSSQAFTAVKTIWPFMGDVLGGLNGLFSNDFTNVGPLYQQWHIISSHLGEGEVFALKTLLSLMKLELHAIDLPSELIFYDYCEQPRYWAPLQANEFAYKPTIEGQPWMSEFFWEAGGPDT